jgi:hypothetical protein
MTDKNYKVEYISRKLDETPTDDMAERLHWLWHLMLGTDEDDLHEERLICCDIYTYREFRRIAYYHSNGGFLYNPTKGLTFYNIPFQLIRKPIDWSATDVQPDDIEGVNLNDYCLYFAVKRENYRWRYVTDPLTHPWYK